MYMSRGRSLASRSRGSLDEAAKVLPRRFNASPRSCLSLIVLTSVRYDIIIHKLNP